MAFLLTARSYKKNPKIFCSFKKNRIFTVPNEQILNCPNYYQSGILTHFPPYYLFQVFNYFVFVTILIFI